LLPAFQFWNLVINLFTLIESNTAANKITSNNTSKKIKAAMLEEFQAFIFVCAKSLIGKSPVSPIRISIGLNERNNFIFNILRPFTLLFM
jgi:hypothetical protein